MTKAEYTEKLFESVQEDLEIYNDYMKQIVEEVLNSEVSKYPIFVACKTHIELGKLLLDREEMATTWSLRVSTLEEFVVKQVVQEDKLEDFKKTYKNPRTTACVLVVDEKGANYVFREYK